MMRLRRKEAAYYIREKYGIPMAASTLAMYAGEGRRKPGPHFYKTTMGLKGGGACLYDTEELDRWVKENYGLPPQSKGEA